MVRAAMRHHRVFQMLVIIAWLIQLTMYLLPIPLWYSDPLFQKFLSYDGYGSLVSLDWAPLHILPLWGFLVAAIGMVFFQNWARYLYLALWAYGWCSTLVFGLRMILPAEGFLGMALGTLDGAILGLAFLSPLRAGFLTHDSSESVIKKDAP